MLILFKTFKNPKGGLLAALRDSGPVPGDDNSKKKGEESAKKKKKADKGVSLDVAGFLDGLLTIANSGQHGSAGRKPGPTPRR